MSNSGLSLKLASTPTISNDSAWAVFSTPGGVIYPPPVIKPKTRNKFSKCTSRRLAGSDLFLSQPLPQATGGTAPDRAPPSGHHPSGAPLDQPKRPYHLADPYLRFYFRFIAPNLNLVEQELTDLLRQPGGTPRSRRSDGRTLPES